MFHIAKVFVLPLRDEGPTLIQNVSGNITMLLFMQKHQKTSIRLTVVYIVSYHHWTKTLQMFSYY